MSRDYEKEIDESNLGEVYKKAFDNRVSKKTFERFEPFFNSNLCLEVVCYDGSVTNLLLSKFLHKDKIEFAAPPFTNSDKKKIKFFFFII